MPDFRTIKPSVPQFSVDELAKANHDVWLKARDRSYSPHNKAWADLTPAARKEISRNVASTLYAVLNAGGVIAFKDEYNNPSPEEAGFVDPQHPNGPPAP